MGNEAKPRKGLSKTTLWFGIVAVIMSVIGCNIENIFSILLMAGGFIFGGLSIIFAIIAILRKFDICRGMACATSHDSRLPTDVST